ncbi:S-(hydroxymethyl)glutathione dehydrogenase [Penicillium subrubescens]|uniref:S-(Hydroxymethyl)glutathione dehydrogenase n=1 Tax=Penicillium subrubescens TaxID=1316194 RepID=A0A1Q5U785_9EURO|nr:S-(hydroxymethyl)glutathione dehydrogenase [Penicillium subrubescens]
MTAKKELVAVTWGGNPLQVNVSTLPIPQILDPTDAIIKVSLAAIGSADIHTYNGVYEDKEVPWVMGQEALGIIVEVGNSVTSFSIGDKVVVPDQTSNGLEDLSTAELMGLGLGSEYYLTTGCQAGYVRVPFANDNLYPIPQNDADSLKSSVTDLDLDYLLATGIFATGWGALDLSGFQPGDSVAIFGAGPIGLMAVYSAILRGASRVFLIDGDRQRLSIAEGLGAMPIDLTHSEPISKILRQEPDGVFRSVDCVGIEAATKLHRTEDKVLQNMTAITKDGGGIGRVGTFKTTSNSSSTSPWQFLLPNFQLAVSGLFKKDPQVRSGVIDSALIAPKLIEMISKGKARPSLIVSSIIDVNEAPQFYERASQHLETKVVIRFP